MKRIHADHHEQMLSISPAKLLTTVGRLTWPPCTSREQQPAALSEAVHGGGGGRASGGGGANGGGGGDKCGVATL